MNELSVDINNGRKMYLSQRKHDGAITVDTVSGKTVGNSFTISAGDLVLLIDYYQQQKEKGEPVF